MNKTKTFFILGFTFIFVFCWIVSYRNSIVTISSRASYLNLTIRAKEKARIPIEDMILSAEEDGMCLVIVSGYRTRAQQQRLYDNAVDKSIVALPGTSEHEHGIAFDLGGCPMKNGIRDDSAERLDLRKPFNEIPEYQWLLVHAREFGFVQSYTSENQNVTGYPPEPWHWKYIGL